MRDAVGRRAVLFLLLLLRPPCSVCLDGGPDILIAAVLRDLAALEGGLVDIERVDEDTLRHRGDERVVLVVERVFGQDDMSGEQHLELLGFCEGRQGMLPLDGRERRPGRLKLRFHGLEEAESLVAFLHADSRSCAVFAAATIEFIGVFNVWWRHGFPGAIMLFVILIAPC